MVHSTQGTWPDSSTRRGVRRQAARLQADDVGHIDRGQRHAAAEQTAGAQDLKVVRGGMAGEAEPLLALAYDFMDDGGRNPSTAEAADGQVIAVVDESGDGVGDGGDLIDDGAGLRCEEGAGVVRGRVGVQVAFAAGEGVHNSVQCSVFSVQRSAQQGFRLNTEH